VLARVTATDPHAPFDLDVTRGVKWQASTDVEDPHLMLTCPEPRHGVALVNLGEVRRQMRSTRRRLTIAVLKG
jgi:hypothetical protein